MHIPRPCPRPVESETWGTGAEICALITCSGSCDAHWRLRITGVGLWRCIKLALLFDDKLTYVLLFCSLLPEWCGPLLFHILKDPSPPPEWGRILHPIFTQELILPFLPYSTYRALYIDSPSLLLCVFPCASLPTPQILHQPWRNGDVNRNHTKTPLNYRAFCWFFVGCVKGSLGLVAVFGDLSWTCSL